jgi:hypothetical protein
MTSSLVSKDVAVFSADGGRKRKLPKDVEVFSAEGASQPKMPGYGGERLRLPTVGVGDVSVSVSTLDVALVPVVDGRNL